MFEYVLPDAGVKPRKQQEFHSAFGLRCACMNKYVLGAIGTTRSEIKNRDHAASFLYKGSRNAHLAHFVSVAAPLRPRS